MPRPILNGVTLPMPVASDPEYQPELSDRTTVEGRFSRTFWGQRRVVSLNWSNSLSQVEMETIRDAARAGLAAPVPYVHIDGSAWSVLTTSRVTPRSVAGTDPQRFNIEIELSEVTPR